MGFKGNFVWKSNVKITVRDLEGRILDVKEFPNLLTNVGFNMVRDLLNGAIADGEIKYMALGDGATAPAVTDTILGNETFRKIMTSQVNGGTGELVSTVYVSPSENNVQIEEIGWLAGAGAGAGSPSGIMVSRVLYSRLKTAFESIEVERTDSIAEA